MLISYRKGEMLQEENNVSLETYQWAQRSCELDKRCKKLKQYLSRNIQQIHQLNKARMSDSRALVLMEKKYPKLERTSEKVNKYVVKLEKSRESLERSLVMLREELNMKELNMKELHMRKLNMKEDQAKMGKERTNKDIVRNHDSTEARQHGNAKSRKRKRTEARKHSSKRKGQGDQGCRQVAQD